jgi:beta-fructofuranosidase
LAHATAPALGGPWTKQPFALSTDPAWLESHLWAPHVIDHDGTYWMFYCAGGPAPSAYRIHLATSEDCVTWTRHPANPMVIDGYEARDPMVARIGDRWVMYYTATSEPTGGHFVVAATESDDLLHWVGRHIVFRDELSGTGGGPCESPFVFEHGGRFHLLIGPDYGGLIATLEQTGRVDPATYRRTRVLRSDDPLSFSIEQQIGTIDAHAAEVVVDEDGGWWVSHCGWGQGGVYLAPWHWPDG